MHTTNYETLLDFAKGVAQEAEVIALKFFGYEVETTWKQDNSALTKADTEINRLVIQRIRETFPEHSIYGEEESYLKENSSYIWVCDPIDGTDGFSCGLPIFVFSLALVDQSTGLPIFGLINDPFMKTMYWAHKGAGACRNGTPLKVSKQHALQNTYTIVGGSGKKVGFSPYPMHKLLAECGSRVMRLPSFIYGAIQIANGSYVGAAFYNEHGHDIAALKIITEEAGGKVTDLNGKERRYDSAGAGCIASNGILHEQLLEIVQKGKL